MRGTEDKGRNLKDLRLQEYPSETLHLRPRSKRSSGIFMKLDKVAVMVKRGSAAGRIQGAFCQPPMKGLCKG